MNFSCPCCGAGLGRQTTDLGVLWRCAGCGGRAVSLALLRQTIDKAFVNALWQSARDAAAPGHSGRRCPSCRGPMRPVVCGQGDEQVDALVLDVCTACQFVWLDAEEPARLPVATAEPKQPDAQPELGPEAREALATMRVALMSERARREDQAERAVWAGEITWLLGRVLRGVFKP